jgi:hypothetical protein
LPVAASSHTERPFARDHRLDDPIGEQLAGPDRIALRDDQVEVVRANLGAAYCKCGAAAYPPVQPVGGEGPRTSASAVTCLSYAWCRYDLRALGQSAG